MSALLALLTSKVGKAAMASIMLIAAIALAHHRGYKSGWNDYDMNAKAELADHLQRAAKEATAIAMQDAQLSEGHEKVRTIWRTRTVTVKEAIPNAITTSCAACTINHGLLNGINAILRADTQDAHPGKSDTGLRIPAPTEGWHVPGSDVRPCCNGRDLKRVQGPPSSSRGSHSTT